MRRRGWRASSRRSRRSSSPLVSRPFSAPAATPPGAVPCPAPADADRELTPPVTLDDAMSLARRLVPAVVVAIGLAWSAVGSALACSAPFVPPSLRDVDPTQVVVLGTIGERVAEGRLFHVERWFNGDQPSTPIVIAFKEGPAVGDCSYPVTTGQRLIIAPMMGADGTLAADLGTLQADPDSKDGRRYVAEASARFGPGFALSTAHAPEPAPTSPPDLRLVLALVAAAVAALFGGAGLLARNARPS